MLDRNKRIKEYPERFQLSKEKFDIIFTCEERVYDHVLESKYFIFLSSFNAFDLIWILLARSRTNASS